MSDNAEALAAMTAVLASAEPEAPAPPVEPAEGEPTIETPAETPPPAEEPAVPEAPPEQLSPQMAQLARRDKGLRERETKLKADLAAYETERAAYHAGRAADADYVKLLKSDIVSAAKRAEMTPEQMQEQARALWYASVGEKAPAEYQTNAKFREVQDELAALKAAREKDAQDREAERAQAQVDGFRRSYAAAIHTYVTGALEGAPMVKAFAEDNPGNVTEELFQIGLRHAQVNPEEPAMSPADLVKAFEESLEAQVAPLRKRGLLSDPKVATPNVPEARAPSALTNQRAATASKSRTAALTEEERHKQAVREYEADLGLR